MTRRAFRAASLLPATVVVGLALASCGGGDSGSGSPSGEAVQGDRISVVASFSPLAYAVERVGGERVEVTNLTGDGADPHHLELTPRQVGAVKDAALVVYEKGMQPAADTAIETAAPARVLDVSSLATLSAEATQTIGEEPSGGHDPAGGETHSAGDGHDHGPNDPHFWLDPKLYADSVKLIADELTAADGAGAETYEANAAALTAEIERVDASYAQALGTCTQRYLVTGHTSFAYLAKAYNLSQVGIAGVLNESEPDPARIGRVVDFVKKQGITTLYAEESEASTVVDTVAREAGATMSTLDNLALTKEGGYASRMEANLTTLRAGQECS